MTDGGERAPGGVAVRLICSGCGAKYRVRGIPPGGVVRCKHCQSPMEVKDGTEVIEHPTRKGKAADALGAILPDPSTEIRPSIPTPAARDEGGSPTLVMPTRPAGPEPSAAARADNQPRRYLDESKLAGMEIGGCRIEGIVGRGGMGVVYRATHLALHRPVAVKVLARAFSSDDRQVGRFKREGKAAASLNHPNVATIHNIGDQEGLHFIVMEFIEGTDLDELVEKEGPVDPARLVELIEPVASALDLAHRSQVVHRDIKPANLILSSDGTVKITDFGLARDYGANDGLTRTGQIVGTPHFMSPEQGEAKTVDARSDIYSLGCTLYFLLTGAKPFEGDSPIAVMVSHIKDHPVPPAERNPLVPVALSDYVLHMMGKAPEDRPASMAEVAQRLASLAAAPSAPAPAPTVAPAPPRPAPAPAAPAPPGPSGGLGAIPPPPEPALDDPGGPVGRRGSSPALKRSTSVSNLNRPSSTDARRQGRRGNAASSDLRRSSHRTGGRQAIRESSRTRRGAGGTAGPGGGGGGINPLIPIALIVALVIAGLLIALFVIR